MNKLTKYIALVILICLSIGSKAQYFNQVGYVSSAKKMLFLDDKYQNKQYKISDEKGDVILEGESTKAKYWEYSGTSVCTVDASSILKEGLYTLTILDASISFKVDDFVHKNVGESILKSFYYARASVPICEEYAGKYARFAGHADDKVFIHSSAADKNRPEGTIISSPGGWYDAGDFNKYIVNSGISTFLLLHTYQLFEDELQSVNINIPESNNATSDLLDEALVNVSWMLTMQDPNDGGVYHKLTSKKFCAMVSPIDDKSERFVIQKSTSAALDFAAVCAKTYRILKGKNEFKALADQCYNAAIKAYEWASKNPKLLYEQPDDIKTGAYGDSDLRDEWFWASTELFLSTQDEAYLKRLNSSIQKFTAPEWRRVSALGIYSALLENQDLGNVLSRTEQLAIIEKIARKSVDKYKESTFKVPIVKFPWGSNSEVANSGFILLIAHEATQNKDYLEVSRACGDYILGANPLGMCFVTGFGFKHPMHLHDRRNSADGIDEPIPGYMAGGPTNSVLTDCGKDKYNAEFPATCYADLECSFSTNEIAINWQSAATSLFLGLHATQQIKESVTSDKTNKRPNIVFFIADDMTRDMFNFLPEGKSKNLTPTLDKLANEGVVMMGQHVSATVCTPSRFNSLTGKFASRANNTQMKRSAKKNGGQRVVEWNTHIIPGEQNVAQILKDNGYYTGAVGKNHVIDVEGHKKVKLADDFSDPIIRKRQLKNYDETIKAYKASGFSFADGIFYENPDFNGPRELAVHNLDWTTEAALHFLDNSAEKEEPFFLYFATTLPHGPTKGDRAWNANRKITPLGYLDEVPDVLPNKTTIPKRIKQAKLSVNDRSCNMLWMDDALNALITKLEETGQAENTIIIFFNDHGQYAKGSVYQGATHNPSVIWKQGGFEVGKQSDALVSNVDFTPTILDWAGISTKDKSFDGKSFASILKGDIAENESAMYFEIGYSRGVRKGNYKYIALRYPEWVKNLDASDRKKILTEYNKVLALRGKEPNNTNPDAPFGHVQIIPGGGDAEFPATQRYPFYSETDQLYDLSSDPNEQKNLAYDVSYKKLLAEMKSELKSVVIDIPGSFGEFKSE